MDHHWFVGSVEFLARWPGESCTCQTSQNPDRYKLILVFLEKKGYKKDALDKRFLANRRYEAISRRPGQTLQDFFATENMAYADAVKAGVGIDPDVLITCSSRAASLNDQINHIYRFAYDPEAVGPGAAQDPRKIQEAVLRFCDKPWDVDLHRDSRASMGQYSRPLMGCAATTHRHQTSYHPRSRVGNKGSYTQEPWEEETFPTEDGYKCSHWDESFSTWQQYSAEELDDWVEEVDLETFLAGESDWIHQDVMDSDRHSSLLREGRLQC